MPAASRIDPSSHTVYSRAWGTLTDDDLVTARAAMVADPAFTPDAAQLYDFSEVITVAVTTEGLRSLAQTTPFAPTARRALVVASDVAFGLARMYMLLSEQEESYCRIFRDRAEALAWLTEAPP